MYTLNTEINASVFCEIEKTREILSGVRFNCIKWWTYDVLRYTNLIALINKNMSA